MLVVWSSQRRNRQTIGQKSNEGRVATYSTVRTKWHPGVTLIARKWEESRDGDGLELGGLTGDTHGLSNKMIRHETTNNTRQH